MLRRVSVAYSVRNAEIGYCQGFNFIIGRFLKVMNDEEAYWMLCQLMERYLPVDYYSKMVGVIIDHNVLSYLIEEKFPDLYFHLSNIGFDPKIVTFQWFSCLFSYNFSFEVLAPLWDHFFLKGSKILFKVSLAIFELMEKHIMQHNSFEDVMNCFDTIPAVLNDP